MVRDATLVGYGIKETGPKAHFFGPKFYGPRMFTLGLSVGLACEVLSLHKVLVGDGVLRCKDV